MRDYKKLEEHDLHGSDSEEIENYQGPRMTYEESLSYFKTHDVLEPEDTLDYEYWLAYRSLERCDRVSAARKRAEADCAKERYENILRQLDKGELKSFDIIDPMKGKRKMSKELNEALSDKFPLLRDKDGYMREIKPLFISEGFLRIDTNIPRNEIFTDLEALGWEEMTTTTTDTATLHHGSLDGSHIFVSVPNNENHPWTGITGYAKDSFPVFDILRYWENSKPYKFDVRMTREVTCKDLGPLFDQNYVTGKEPGPNFPMRDSKSVEEMYVTNDLNDVQIEKYPQTLSIDEAEARYYYKTDMYSSIYHMAIADYGEKQQYAKLEQDLSL